MSRAKTQQNADAQAACGIVVPPGTPAWITADLIRLTLKVWQKRYTEQLSIEEAVTIVLNAGRLFGVLSRE